MKKILLRILGGILLLAVAMGAAALGYRALHQHQTAKLLQLEGPEVIEEAGFVRIGGVEQWVQIRGERRDNPVLLFLHGGPGFTAIPYFHRVMRPWERDYTIVHWDQRGAGKSYRHNGTAEQPHPTLEQMIADGIEVAEYVRTRLGQPKMILVGYSWGSVLGLELARRRPDLFVAFVGTGQVLDTARSESAGYHGVLARARAAGDEDSIATLERIGPPPYDGVQELGAERQVLNRYPPPGESELDQFRTLLLAPGYSLRDVIDVYYRAPELTRELLSVVLQYKVTDRGTRFDLPLFFFQGEDDLWTSTEVVEEYLPVLQAPHKEIVRFADVGHHAVEVSGAQFLAELNARVRPLALQEQRTAAQREATPP